MASVSILSFGASQDGARWVWDGFKRLKEQYHNDAVVVIKFRDEEPHPRQSKYVDGQHEQTVVGVFSNEAFAGIITNITNDCIGNRHVVQFIIVFGTSAVYRADTSGRTLTWSMNAVEVDGAPMFQAQHFPLWDKSEKDDVDVSWGKKNWHINFFSK